MEPTTAFKAQFALRRSHSMSETLVRWIDDPAKRSQCTGPFDLDGEKAVAREFFNEVDALLADQFGYRLNEDGVLLTDRYTDEEIAHALAGFQRRAIGNDR